MAIPIYDSRFPKEDYDRMAAAVADTQQRRATIMGPPLPAPPFSMQGVEKQAADRLQAQRDLGPMQPMIVNGVPSFTPQAPAQTPRPAPVIAPMVAQTPAVRQAPLMSAPLPAPAPAASPFGGMDARPLSARGGPMNYSQQGVGTNNPNAYAVGQNRAPLGLRLLERAARRRDPRAILALASMEQQNAQQGQQLGLMQMREAADAARFNQQQQNQLTMFERQQLSMQERDAANFGQQKEIMQMQSEQRANESALEFQLRQEAEAAQREAEGDPTQVTTAPIPGTEYVIPFAGKKAMGTLPVVKAEAPLPAGLVPTGAVRGGVQYGPAQTTTDNKAPAFTYEKEPGTGRITGAVYPVQDPQTGQWRLQRADLNGDGVVSPEEAAAVPAGAASVSTALKTKAGNSYTFK